VDTEFQPYIERTFEILLRCVVLCEHGHRISPERVRIRAKPSPLAVDHVTYDDPFLFRRTSPSLYLLAELLSSLLRYAEVVDTAGRVRSIDGFVLKEPNRWEEPSRADPNEILSYVSGACGISCTFCYLKGNPPEIRRVHRGISEQELLYRLDLFKRGVTLFPKNIVSTDEQTTNPHLLHILQEVREKTHLPIAIETNGVHLNRGMVEAFGALGNCFVNVSVNSVSSGIRKRLLHDHHPERVKTNISALAEAKIPFSVSIVPWYEIPLDDMEQTIHFADSFSANHIRVRLPGYTSFFSTEKLYDLDDWWQMVIRRVQPIREVIDTPVIIEPSKYEQLLSTGPWALPVVLGVIRNSPAYRGGVSHGDYLRAVNKRPFFWRADGLRELTRLLVNEKDVELDIQRGQTRKTVHLHYDARRSYPYSSEDYRSPYGLFLCDDIHSERVRLLNALLHDRNPEHPVLITSRLMKKSVTMLLEMFGILRDFPDLELAVVPNTYMGGNVFMGDLLVVRDILAHARTHWQGSNRPDLLVVPSSGFNEYGRDLLGEPYKTIERRTDIPVILFPARIISL
jgi:MoaA/NifB/PqqE/SkfB family radical SAM enzyme